MKIALLIVASLWLAAAPAISPAAEVMLVGTFHFANPGADQHNVEAVDVLTEDAQRQIQAITGALAAFEPSRVFVEWPEDVVDQRYAQYLDDTLEPSRNEVVQLGFRLAKARGLNRVHGIDVDGDFPFEAISRWAEGNGQASRLQASQAQVGEMTKRIEAIQRDDGIAAALRLMNSEQSLRDSRAFHMDLLRYGKGDDQPGAALNTAWFDRNMRICARLLQSIEADDRAVVFFGAGHIPWLQRCLDDAPGVELVTPLPYLPAD
jgi:hypothetical protein